MYLYHRVITKTILMEEQEETSGGDEQVYDIDCGDDFVVVYLSLNLPTYIYIMCSFLYVKKIFLIFRKC